MTLLALARVGGGILPVDEPVLHADDLAVLRGQAVFETIRVYGGTPFRLGMHLERLLASARRLGLPAPDRAGFEEGVAGALAAAGAGDAALRLLWTAGREGGGTPVGLVLVSPLASDIDELRAQGLRVAVVPWAPGALAGAKSTSYAENMAARDRAVAAGADDALFVTPDDIVLEAPTSNVWIREGDSLVTPGRELPLLAGVTRGALLELAPSVGYTAREATFALGRLLAADEVFYSSSLREVTPVVEVDGAPVGGGSPGPAAAALQRALRGIAG
jgi:4-amino-4-deoxychorismate lyase